MRSPDHSRSVADSASKVMVMAEMHGRDLTRRHAALALLVALPLAFFFASSGEGVRAVSAGGIGMAFSVSGATLFSILSSEEVDQRLVLGGYRPIELLAGRLVFLGPLGLLLAGVFAAIMMPIASPPRPWVVVLGVAVVALQSVPFGLAVGSVVPRELEGTLVLIGVVGMQLATDASSAVAKALPFYGARRILGAGVDGSGPILWPLGLTAGYALALLVVARVFVDRRVNVAHHERLFHTTDPRAEVPS